MKKSMLADSRHEIAKGSLDMSPAQIVDELDSMVSTATAAGIAEAAAEAGLFPMFGMPTRERSLYTKFQPGEGEDSPEEWSTFGRDLDLAISEFAPGQVLVRDKRMHLCVGFTPEIGESRFSRSGGKPGFVFQTNGPTFSEEIRLLKCDQCGAWQNLPPASNATEVKCPACSQLLAADTALACVTPAAFRSDFTSRSPDEELTSATSAQRLTSTILPNLHLKPVANSNLLVTTEEARTFRLNKGPSGNGYTVQNGTQRFPIAKGLGKSDWYELSGQAMAPVDGSRTAGSWTLDPATRPVALFAGKHTHSLWLAPQAIPVGLALGRLPYAVAANVDKDKGRWIGIRAAALSAAFLIAYRAGHELDIDPDELEILEPQTIVLGGARTPLLCLADRAPNGAGYCLRLGESTRGQTLVLDLIRSMVEDASDPLGSDLREPGHMKRCLKACYSCLMRYGNQPYHGLLDWRLGMDYLRILMDPKSSSGLESNVTDCFWRPELDSILHSEAVAANKRIGIGGEVGLIAGRIPTFFVERDGERRIVLVVHPFWRDDPDPLGTRLLVARAKDEAVTLVRGDPSRIEVWDYFNLARRPMRVLEWIFT